MIKLPMESIYHEHLQFKMYDKLENNPKKFYCATGLNNIKNGKLFIDYMISKGYECTMNWTCNLSVEPYREEYDTLHTDETNANASTGIDRADFVVVLLPGARGDDYRTHFEMGYAVAKNKPVFIYNINSKRKDIPFYRFCNPLTYIIPANDLKNLFD